MDGFPRITRTQQHDEYDLDNSVVKYVLVTYFAGPKDGPYTRKWPADTPLTTIRAELDQHARDLQQLRGA